MRTFHRACLALSLLIIAGTAVASNRLAGHPSPYLALHAGDPVDWQSWQAGVFAKARARNRLVLVSVGYFSCHWCHVMQRQSYRHAGTADFLNRHFISVKVDRELEPELDRRLIEFVRKLRGAAGWPLNVILTPEGYPLTGFTYLPQDQFLRVMQRLATEWQENHAGLSAAARAYFESARQALDRAPVELDASSLDLLEAFVGHALRAADELQGGFGDTSKFPMVPQLDSLLDSLERLPGPDPEIAEFIRLTLDSMAALNLQDHVNGGFFRYTTDPDWRTPHFEKMLYDNAMLASLYLKAERFWPDRGYRETALRTLDFIEARLAHPRGGYMSSLSAVDSTGREGAAYLWSQEQLRALLTPGEYTLLRNQWHFDSFSDDFLLRPPAGAAPARMQAGTGNAILKKLHRADVARMPADDKRLAGWNALVLDALTRAADQDARFGERARRQFATMREIFLSGGNLVRFAGHADIGAAVLEDYALCAAAFLRFGERFDDAEAIRLARRLVEDAHRLFLRDGRWQAGGIPLLPLDGGQWVIEDRVFHSPMTLWLRTALALPQLDPGVRASAARLLRRVSPEMLDRPFDYGSLITLRARMENRIP